MITITRMRRSLRGTRMVAAMTAPLMVVGAVALAAAPPAAAVNASVALAGVQANGTVGVPQTLVVTASIPGARCGSVLAPAATILAAANGSTQNIGSATFTTCVGSVFQYSFQWLPASAGAVFVSASVVDSTSTAVRSAIAPVSTTTRITVADTVRLGVPTTLTASVTANGGSLMSPQGTIQFSVLGGGGIGGPVALNNAVPATVQVQWTPAVLGQTAILATYIPATVNGTINATCGASCSSLPDSVQVTSSGVLIYLANPPGFAVGLPSTITAVVSAFPPTGVVTFTVNGVPIASNVPVPPNGVVTASWAPPLPGPFSVGAYWTSSAGLRGSASDTIVASAEPAQSDVISLAPQGQGAWSTTGQYSLRNGTSTTFITSASSGSPVSLTVSGPCTLNGATLTLHQGTGQCRLVASTTGGNGYGPAQAIYTVSLASGNQVPRGTIRASGDIRRGTTFTLTTRANNVTNAGQRMTWSITSGANRCQLRYPSNGSVQLRAVSNGSCNVRATAAAIAGQWNRMVLNRTYRVR
jgi:hypothetical protein